MTNFLFMRRKEIEHFSKLLMKNRRFLNISFYDKTDIDEFNISARYYDSYTFYDNYRIKIYLWISAQLRKLDLCVRN